MVEIKTENLSKKFKSGSEVTALNNINLTFPEKKIILLAGPSGSGKTTLLSLIGLLLKPTSGKILFDREEVSLYSDRWQTFLRREKIGFVFQQFYLEPRLNVWENVSLPLLCRETKENERFEISEKILITPLSVITTILDSRWSHMTISTFSTAASNFVTNERSDSVEMPSLLSSPQTTSPVSKFGHQHCK